MKHPHHPRKKPMTTQNQTITNPGPSPIKVSGGTLTSPVTLAPSASGSFAFTDSSPLHIELLATGGGDLAGGHGDPD